MNNSLRADLFFLTSQKSCPCVNQNKLQMLTCFFLPRYFRHVNKKVNMRSFLLMTIFLKTIEAFVSLKQTHTHFFSELIVLSESMSLAPALAPASWAWVLLKIRVKAPATHFHESIWTELAPNYLCAHELLYWNWLNRKNSCLRFVRG